MLISYAVGETVPFRLPHDIDDPTIIEGYPLLTRDRNRHAAVLRRLQERYERMAEIPDDDVKSADALSDEEVAFLQTRVKALHNIKRRGQGSDKDAERISLTEPGEIIDWFEGLPSDDRNILITTLQSCKRLEALRKR